MPGDADTTGRAHRDAVWIAPGLAYQVTKGCDLLAQVGQGDHDWHPPVGNLGRLGNAFGGEGSNENGNSGAHWLKAQLEATVQLKYLAVIVQGFASEDQAH